MRGHEANNITHHHQFFAFWQDRGSYHLSLMYVQLNPLSSKMLSISLNITSLTFLFTETNRYKNNYQQI